LDHESSRDIIGRAEIGNNIVILVADLSQSVAIKIPAFLIGFQNGGTIERGLILLPHRPTEPPAIETSLSVEFHVEAFGQLLFYTLFSPLPPCSFTLSLDLF
jgi:hypothetical protein